MYDHNQANQPSDELTQSFWQAWREQLGKSPRLMPLLLQRGRHLLERFHHFYTLLRLAPHPVQRRWQRKLGASLAGVALTLALSSTPAAYAASITVGGSCTLVDAITAANSDTAVGGCAAGSGADTITLAGGTITVTSVSAPNATYGDTGLPIITSAITIAGNGATITRASSAPEFRIMGVSASGNLTLNDTTITGGFGDASGAGLFNQGTATLNNSTVSGNTLTFVGVGGGIANLATLTLNNSTVSGNSAYNIGGGIFNDRTGRLTLTNSTVSGNTSNNRGGGIHNFGNGTLTLERSLISGNTGSSANEIYSVPYACYQPYYGIPICGGGTVNSANDNLFGHSGESNAQAFHGFAPSGSDITATSDGTAPTALAGILCPLANNGGPTRTAALVTGSPAIDAVTTGPATDQRGVTRPQGAAFDIGAFEGSVASCSTNTAPVATNDSYSTNEDTVLNVPAPGVLGNDTDAEHNALTAVLVSGPAHGTLTLNPDGSFTYTPAANFSGADSFTYKANDGQADSNVATVSLTVVSAANQIDLLIAKVQALVNNGTLSAGNANKLLKDLDQAKKHLEKGQTTPTVNMLQHFIGGVQSLINSGVLPAAQGQPLIDDANAIIHSLQV